MKHIISSLFSTQFILYLCFGGAAAVVNLVTGQVLYYFFDFFYACAVLIGALSGMLVNFFLNYYYNFRYRLRSMSGQLFTFIVVSLIGTVLTSSVAELCLNFLHLLSFTSVKLLNTLTISAEFCSHAFAIAAITFYSFFAHKYFSFNVGFLNRLRVFYQKIRATRDDS